MTLIGSRDGTAAVPLPGPAGDPGSAGMSVTWGMRSDVGYRRPRNEDSAIATGVLFSVADGMGGHAAGDLASAAVVTQFGDDELSFPVSASDIYSSLVRASESVARISQASGRDAGTTVTGAALTDVDGVASWLVFNIGDSRVYAYREHQLFQVTRDHSLVQELVDRGQITEAEAEVHPDRNQILKAIGFDMDPVPDFWSTPLSDGLRLLVCSDGLSKELRAPSIATILSAHDDAAGAADALVSAALDAGGNDNVTVVVVDVHGGPAAAPRSTPDTSGVDAQVGEEDTLPR